MCEAELLDSVLSCNLNLVKKLTESIMTVNFQIAGTDGLTLLHVAAGINSPESGLISSHLLQMKADPNARAIDELTPVHIAAMWNNYFVLEKLLVFGGNPFLCDIEKKTALSMALENNSEECYELLCNFEYNLDQGGMPGQVTAVQDVISNNALQEISENKSDKIISNTTQKDCTKENTCTDILSNLISSKLKNGTSERVKKFQRTKRWVETINKFMAEKNGIVNNPETSSVNPDLLTKKSNALECCNTNLPHSQTVSSENTGSNGPVKYSRTSSTTEIETTFIDEKEGITLIEKQYLTLTNDTYVNVLSNTQESCQSDWKMFQTAYSSLPSSKSTCSSHAPVKIPENLKKLSNSEIFLQLKQLGDNPGPILDSTRNPYLQRLAKLKNGKVYLSPKTKYSPEVHLFLNDKLNLHKIHQLEYEMAEDFNKGALVGRYREGNRRCSFNYFLLDPRVTRNLPLRAPSLTLKESFNIFLDALFYVGKGTKGRPYSHLYEAAKACVSENKKLSDKVLHILDIWRSGLGVVSLHCFQNSVPVEAFTREACIIEAVGLSNLTNIKKGNFYGVASRWTIAKKRRVGVLILSRALEIFLLEGERSIRPKDLKM